MGKIGLATMKLLIFFPMADVTQPTVTTFWIKLLKVLPWIGLAGFILLIVIAGGFYAQLYRKADPYRSFADYAGFKDYYANYPPQEQLPTPREQELLKKYYPRLYTPQGYPGPIDFYRDYIAQGKLVNGEGELVSNEVTPELLNRYKNTRGIQFIHQDKGIRTTPAVYGRVDYDTLTITKDNQVQEYPFTYLSYHFVFRTSGLPAGMPKWQTFFIDLFLSMKDWHQLDHYTAVTMILDEGEKPVAVMMQQHNYMTTYLIGQDVELPSDKRVGIDVAIGSNELYPHEPGRVKRRAASFLSPGIASYVILGGKKPLMAAEDVTEGVQEVAYNLEFLPQTDAFYLFTGRLGQLRYLPGRDGPPGSDYNTMPAIKPKAISMVYNYRGQNKEEYVQLLEDTFQNIFSRRIKPEFVQTFGERFIRDWENTASNE